MTTRSRWRFYIASKLLPTTVFVLRRYSYYLSTITEYILRFNFRLDPQPSWSLCFYHPHLHCKRAPGVQCNLPHKIQISPLRYFAIFFPMKSAPSPLIAFGALASFPLPKSDEFQGATFAEVQSHWCRVSKLPREPRELLGEVKNMIE